MLDPDALFGDLLFPIVSLSVAIILFEGALTLHFDDLSGHGKMVRNLCTIGAVITWLVASSTAHYFLEFSWQISFLFGAIVTVTGPTVIMPMLRTVRPNPKIANILRWEGIVIDPIGALLAVLVYEFIVSSQNAWSHTFQAFGISVFVGMSFGCSIGYILGWVLRKDLIPHYLKNTAVLTLMLGAYAGSNAIAHESGLLTVTVMGMWLANMKNVDVESIIEFKETLSVLLISALFILLAARIDFSVFHLLGWQAVLVVASIIFIARPLSAIISSYKADLTWRETALISWIAPRGIIAAAVSALFALKLETMAFNGANLLVPMVFLVIIVTVVLQSLTAKPIAKALKVRSPAPIGILIFGAGRFARLFAKELTEKNVRVHIADTNWDFIRQTRMAGIASYYGNPTSDHAARNLDFSQFGKVLVLSPYRQLNPVVTYHFEYLLGKNSVLNLTNNENESRSSHQFSNDYAKRLNLFSDEASYSKLTNMITRGATIKTTQLSESYTLDDYMNSYENRMIPLVAFDPNNRLHIYSTTSTFKPKSDWQVMSLIMPLENSPQT